MTDVIRKFTTDDQLVFADLTGDFNPLHLDPLIARRGMAGDLIVHGIHLLLWALDKWCAKREAPFTIVNLDVAFARPVLVGVEVSLAMAIEAEGKCSMVIFSGGVEVTLIALVWDERSLAVIDLPGKPTHNGCKNLSATDIPGRSGSLTLHCDINAASALFPRLAATLPAVQLASLLATTRLVGVECPGLHSLYSELKIASNDEVEIDTLDYTVIRFDSRFNLVTMSIEAPGLRGSIKAFLRPDLVQQPSCAFISTEVEPTRFANQRALVVGGSRGLGEVIAKVLAMGGSDVVLSYHRGKTDAEAVVQDITAHGGRARSLCLDVMSTNSTEALDLWRPTHIYYMATPHISIGNKGVFSSQKFALFCAYYVEGFAHIVDCMKSPSLVGVFYPSSVFLDEQPLDMTEYVAAKSAGEAICGMLQKANPAVRFLQSRLPRLSTDQTSSLMPISNQSPLPIILALLETFAHKFPEKQV